MSPIFFALPGNESLAGRLAVLTRGAVGALQSRQFPDGETYLRFMDEPKDRDVALVCTLDRPDAKLAPLLFAAETARVQETHILAGHMLCDWIDMNWKEQAKAGD